MGSAKKCSVYMSMYSLIWDSVLHAILIMVQATTLNVAFNSHNKSLLTIMMSNNVSTHVHKEFIWFCLCTSWWLAIQSREASLAVKKQTFLLLYCWTLYCWNSIPRKICTPCHTFSSRFLSLQFVEIKGSVFKKFEKNNLFQMSNSGK